LNDGDLLRRLIDEQIEFRFGVARDNRRAERHYGDSRTATHR
jgi:hypothetical protein